MSEASVRLATMAGTLTVDELIQVLRTEADLLAGEAAQAFVTDPVPTCPQWSVRDLVEHTGGVHRWAATVVKGALTQDIPDTEPTRPPFTGWMHLPPGSAGCPPPTRRASPGRWRSTG